MLPCRYPAVESGRVRGRVIGYNLYSGGRHAYRTKGLLKGLRRTAAASLSGASNAGSCRRIAAERYAGAVSDYESPPLHTIQLR